MPAEPLVSTDWLAEQLRNPSLRVVDIRGFVTTRPVVPGVEHATYRGAREEYLAGHIPGAVYVNWTTDITDPDDRVPAQIAPPHRFAEAMADRGIGDGTTVVAVDHAGGQFATRLWWALSYYGHDDVAVLDGGWNRWVDEGREVESGEVTQTRAEFTPQTRPRLRVTAEDVLALLSCPTASFAGRRSRSGPVYRRYAVEDREAGISRARSTSLARSSLRLRAGSCPSRRFAAGSRSSGSPLTVRRSLTATGVSPLPWCSSTWRGSVFATWRITTDPGTSGGTGWIYLLSRDTPRGIAKLGTRWTAPHCLSSLTKGIFRLACIARRWRTFLNASAKARPSALPWRIG